jgi:5-methylcytosine-specific restriction endonuclease McrA
VDHILPVCEGGGLCGLDNLRLLCGTCHKAECDKLARRRAQ